jgi:hypothetical protein
LTREDRRRVLRVRATRELLAQRTSFALDRAMVSLKIVSGFIIDVQNDADSVMSSGVVKYSACRTRFHGIHTSNKTLCD